MRNPRIQFNLSLQEAQTILQILKDYGGPYTHNEPRHTDYNNDHTTAKLQRMIHFKLKKENGMDNKKSLHRPRNRRGVNT